MTMTNETNETETATTETATTETAAVAAPKSAHNNYPFQTKKQIALRLATDPGFVRDCLVILYDRQTSDEAETSSTKYKNARGFMSSHAVHGTRLAKMVLAGEEMTDEDTAKVAEIVPRYTKQLAEHFRAKEIMKNPKLAVEAASFFKPQA